MLFWHIHTEKHAGLRDMTNLALIKHGCHTGFLCRFDAAVCIVRVYVYMSICQPATQNVNK